MPDIIKGMPKLTEEQKQMVVENKGIVYRIAQKYESFPRDMDDIIQDGMFGLMRATQKFDNTRGMKFSTYAWKWIKQTIRRGIMDHCSCVRVPRSTFSKKTRLRVLSEKFDEDTITDEELKELEKLDSAFLNSIAKKDMSLNVNIDNSVKVNNVVEYQDLIVSDDFDNVEKKHHLESLREEVKRISKTLSNRESRVLFLRFGIGTGMDAMTLEEVGDYLHLTKERIRQIEKTILLKLRHTSRSSRLRIFLGQ